MDEAQRAALDRYFAAMQSGGARVLSNATQARKILDALAAPTPKPSTLPANLPMTLTS